MTDKQQKLEMIKSKIAAALQGLRRKTDSKERQCIVFEKLDLDGITEIPQKPFPLKNEDHQLVVVALAVIGDTGNTKTFKSIISGIDSGYLWHILHASFEKETDLQEFLSLFRVQNIQKLSLKAEERLFLNMLNTIGLSLESKDVDDLYYKYNKHGFWHQLVDSIIFTYSEEYMKDRIIFIAQVLLGIAIIGGYAVYLRHHRKSSSDKPRQNMSKNEPAQTPSVASPAPKPAILMLVLAANKLGNAQEGVLSADAVLQLVEASAYFGCFPPKKANELEGGITGMVNEEFSRESAQYVYISVSFDDGDDLIQASAKFGLKQCLRNTPERTCAILKMRLLDHLEGIDKLRRY